MKIEVNIDKKYFFILLGAILIFSGAIYGYAQDPAIFGHGWNEIEDIPAEAERWANWSEIGSMPAGFADGVDDVGGVTYGSCTYYRTSSASWCFPGYGVLSDCPIGKVVRGVNIAGISNHDNEQFCLRIRCCDLS